MRNVLIVEDFAEFSTALKKVLVSKYNVEICATLREARAHVDSSKPVDLVLLDLDLPDGSGLEFCSYLSQNELTQDIPILILSGKADPHVKVASLNLGADDFLDKPVRMDELMARIHARLRRSARRTTAQVAGGFQIDENLHKVYLMEAGSRIDLQFSPVEFRIFTRMLQHPGVLYTRDQLISMVSGTGHNVSDRSIDSHVYAIRKKLGPRREQLKTMRGIGYMIDLQSGTAAAARLQKNSAG